MFKWFWPGMTWTAALTALALWFGADRVETDIATRTGAALAPFVWTGLDVDGRDVTLKGIAPDPEAQSAAQDALANVWGIREITDLTSVLPLVSPYALQIRKSADGIILSGSVPDNDVRDRIMTAAESAAPGIPLDDQMATVAAAHRTSLIRWSLPCNFCRDCGKGRSGFLIAIFRSRAGQQTRRAIKSSSPD